MIVRKLTLGQLHSTIRYTEIDYREVTASTKVYILCRQCRLSAWATPI